MKKLEAYINGIYLPEQTPPEYDLAEVLNSIITKRGDPDRPGKKHSFITLKPDSTYQAIIMYDDKTRLIVETFRLRNKGTPYTRTLRYKDGKLMEGVVELENEQKEEVAKNLQAADINTPLIRS